MKDAEELCTGRYTYGETSIAGKVLCAVDALRYDDP